MKPARREAPAGLVLRPDKCGEGLFASGTSDLADSRRNLLTFLAGDTALFCVAALADAFCDLGQRAPLVAQMLEENVAQFLARPPA